MTPEDAIRVGLVLVVIGSSAVIKGVTGFGFPLTAVPLISIILDPRSAAVILSIVSIFGNVNMMLRGGGRRSTFRRLLPMIGGLVVGTVLGALLLANLDAALLSAIVGTCVLIFAALSTVKPDLAVPEHLERYFALPMGLLGGILGGSTSIFAPGVAAYLHALHLDKREFVFFVTLLFTIGGAVQIVSYIQLGLYNAWLLLIVLLSLVPNALGINLGLRIHDRIDQLVFRRVVLVLIFGSGLSLLAKGVWR